MKLLHNPTSNNLEIKYKGIMYSIPAMGKLKVEDDIAMYWKTQIHNFLKITNIGEDEEIIPATSSLIEEVPTKTTKKSK